MKTIFNWVDADGNEYLTEKTLRDGRQKCLNCFLTWHNRRKKFMLANIEELWGTTFGGNEKGLASR